MTPLTIRLIAIAAGAILAAIGGLVYRNTSVPPAATVATVPPGAAPGTASPPPQAASATAVAPPAPVAPIAPPQSPAIAALPPTVAEPSAAAAGASLPQFDIVRVSPEGEAVVAGRASANARVELIDGDAPIAATKADAAGQFVLLPPALPRGDHFLALRTIPDGAAPVVSTQSVTVSVRPGTSPIVTLAEPGKPSVVLAAPAPAPVAEQSSSAAASRPGQVTIQTAEVEAGGRFFATGSAAPGSTVRFYLNGTHVADAGTAGDGKWSLTITRGVSGGRYALRADAVDSQGKVASRAEVPFDAPVVMADAQPSTSALRSSPTDAPPPSSNPAGPGTAVSPAPSLTASPQTAPVTASPPSDAASRPLAPTPASPASPTTRPSVRDADRTGATPTPPRGTDSSSHERPLASNASTGPSAVTAHPVIAEISTATVSRGDSLWRISRQRFGRGIRYTVIYEANSQQIRNPRLIYPGQVLVMPKN